MSNSNTKPTLEMATQWIVSETYTLLPSGKQIVCELMHANGFAVAGIASVVDLDNYDEDKGKQVAFDRAMEKVFEHLAFSMQQSIHAGDIESRHKRLAEEHKMQTAGRSMTLARRGQTTSMPPVFRHYRNKKLYDVLAVAHNETLGGQPLVIYRSRDEGLTWARPHDEFYGNVEDDGLTVQRFTRVIGLPTPPELSN